MNLAMRAITGDHIVTKTREMIDSLESVREHYADVAGVFTIVMCTRKDKKESK
jgi:hypothetical protein